jgi:hypothetical protein
VYSIFNPFCSFVSYASGNRLLEILQIISATLNTFQRRMAATVLLNDIGIGSRLNNASGQHRNHESGITQRNLQYWGIDSACTMNMIIYESACMRNRCLVLFQD